MPEVHCSTFTLKSTLFISEPIVTHKIRREELRSRAVAHHNSCGHKNARFTLHVYSLIRISWVKKVQTGLHLFSYNFSYVGKCEGNSKGVPSDKENNKDCTRHR